MGPRSTVICRQDPRNDSQGPGVKGCIKCYGFHVFSGCFHGFVTHDNVVSKIGLRKRRIQREVRGTPPNLEGWHGVRLAKLSSGESSLSQGGLQPEYLEMARNSILLSKWIPSMYYLGSTLTRFYANLRRRRTKA